MPSDHTAADVRPGLRAFVRHHPVASYFTLTFLISWGLWIPTLYHLGRGQGQTAGLCALVLAYVGVYGPSLAALAIGAVLDGRQGIVRLLRKFLIWRCHPVWYGVALLAPVLMRAGAVLVSMAGGRSAPQLDLSRWAAVVPIVLVSLVGGPLGEEAGWRGFALPRLRVRLGPLPSSILVGVIWGLWHLPEFVWAVPGITPPISFASFLVGTVANSVLFAWILDHTDGSLLLAVLYHTSLNATANFLALLSPSLSSGADLMRPTPWVFSGAALVAVLVSRWRLIPRRSD